MRFYKQKRFHIPLLVLLLLLIVATALLYKPLKLVYWANEVYPKEEQGLQEHNRYMNKPFSFLIKFQPKLEDFQELNKQIQTIKRDFIIMDKIGLGEVYLEAILTLHNKFADLSKNKKLFFSYPETRTLNQSQMQQYKEILRSTQELKEAISKEQFQLMQTDEDFYQLVSKNTNNLVYVYRNNTRRFGSNGIFLLSNMDSDEICPPYKYVETFLPRMQESYMILKELKPNADVLKYIDQGSYGKFMKKVTKGMEITQALLSNCKRID